MTEDHPKAQEKPPGRLKALLTPQWKWVRRSGAVVTFLGISYAAVSYTPIGSLFGLHGDLVVGDKTEINNIYSSPSGGSQQLPAASDASTSEALAPQIGIGTCLSSGKVVPCDTEHNQEVIGTDPASCDVSALYGYVSGNPDFDFFGPSVFVSEHDGSCVAKVPARTSSIQGVWAESNVVADPLRACYVGEQASPKIVDCSQRHAGEITYQQPVSNSGDMRCEERAEEYTNAPQTAWGNVLQAYPLDDEGDGLRRCVLTTRSDGTLETGLRNLRNTKVKISS